MVLAFAGSATAQPPFAGNIVIEPDNGPDGEDPIVVPVNGSLVLTATYNPNRNVTHYEWSIDVDSQGEIKITEDGDDDTQEDGGTTSFVFDPTALGLVPGAYEVCFRIWHDNPNQSDRDATECVIITVVATSSVIEAGVAIDPKTLNLKSKGNPVTCYIVLPLPYDVLDIDIGSILLNNSVPVALKKNGSLWYDFVPYSYSDENGILEYGYCLMVKFDRSEVQDILEEGDAVEVEVTGKVNADDFRGVDFIRVIDSGLSHCPGGSMRPWIGLR